jgi:adenosylcobinamide-phosphate synthase
MKLWQKVLCAAVLDAALGDPPYRPHPARLMGRLAVVLENPCRRLVDDEKRAGTLAAALVVSSSLAAAGGLLRLARYVHPRAGDLVSVALLYTSLAARDLCTHALGVERALGAGDLDAARLAVSRMVGRDTTALDAEGVVRATVESVAENTVDGVISPLFYALVGGAPAATAFKAVSTLDSTFGYKNERYTRFGWASARLDDAANYLPARLAVPFIAVAAGAVGRSPLAVLRTVRDDGRSHASPNAGLAEAGFAGALGVRLGGPVSRDGRLVSVPYMGHPKRALSAGRIREAVWLMWLAYGLVLGAGLALRCRGWYGLRAGA